jgi:hypothetical protein
MERSRQAKLLRYRFHLLASIFSALMLWLAWAYNINHSTQALVELDNPSLWMTAQIYDPLLCPHFAGDLLRHSDSLENVVKDTLPMEWGSNWPAEAYKAGAVIVRTTIWEHWYNPQGPGEYNFTTLNLNKNQGAAYPNCRNARINYWPGGGAQYGNVGYGTNRAVDETYGMYIPGLGRKQNQGDIVKYIEWGAVRQHRTRCKAEQGGYWYDAVIFAMQPYANIQNYDVNNQNTWCNPGTDDNTMRPGPLALEQPYVNGVKNLHGPIMGAYIGNNLNAYNIGYPYNHGGTEWVHQWGAGWAQDFTGGLQGAGALIQANANSSVVYWIWGGIWIEYQQNQGGAEGWLGYPTSNKQWASSPCGYNSDYQTFQNGFIFWSCAEQGYRTRLYSDVIGLTSDVSNLSVLPRGGSTWNNATVSISMRCNLVFLPLILKP